MDSPTVHYKKRYLRLLTPSMKRQLTYEDDGITMDENISDLNNNIGGLEKLSLSNNFAHLPESSSSLGKVQLELEECPPPRVIGGPVLLIYKQDKVLFFTATQIKFLQVRMSEIEEALQKQDLSSEHSEKVLYMSSLGRGLYVTIFSRGSGVGFHRHWVPMEGGLIKLGKNGMDLSTLEWEKFKEKLIEILTKCPDLFNKDDCHEELEIGLLEYCNYDNFWKF